MQRYRKSNHRGGRLLMAAVLTVLLAVFGCSDGEDGRDCVDCIGNIDGEAVQSGVFLDGPVEGLTYVSGRLHGFTDHAGRFSYQEGETVQFKVGDIVLGETEGKGTITPIDLVEGAVDATEPAVVNMIRFLQTIDEDMDSTNGIQILSDGDYDDLSLDFSRSEEAFSAAAEPIVDSVFMGHRDLISREAAIAHFHYTLLKIPGSSIDTALQDLLCSKLDPYELPGIAMGIALPDGAVWKGACGEADMDTGEPMSPDMSYRIGSVTKTFTAQWILQLIQEERLTLDDTLESLLPGVLDEKFQPSLITVRMLLQHTTGIPNFTDDMGWLVTYISDPSVTFTPTELLEIAEASDPYFEPPGLAWAYSNTNYILLAMIGESITGQPWESQVWQRFIEPLNLPGTEAPPTGDLGFPGPHAAGYLDLFEKTEGAMGEPGVLLDFSTVEPSTTWASGNIISTPEGIARWMKAIGESDFMAPHIFDMFVTEKFYVTDTLASGLGMIFDETYRMMQHPGQILGYDSGGYYNIPDRAGFGVYTNRTLTGGEKIHTVVLYDALALIHDIEMEDGGDTGHRRGAKAFAGEPACWW